MPWQAEAEDYSRGKGPSAVFRKRTIMNNPGIRGIVGQLLAVLGLLQLP